VDVGLRLLARLVCRDIPLVEQREPADPIAESLSQVAAEPVDLVVAQRAAVGGVRAQRKMRYE
jgi:hypothetical protein